MYELIRIAILERFPNDRVIDSITDDVITEAAHGVDVYLDKMVGSIPEEEKRTFMKQELLSQVIDYTKSHIMQALKGYDEYECVLEEIRQIIKSNSLLLRAVKIVLYWMQCSGEEYGIIPWNFKDLTVLELAEKLEKIFNEFFLQEIKRQEYIQGVIENIEITTREYVLADKFLLLQDSSSHTGLPLNEHHWLPILLTAFLKIVKDKSEAIDETLKKRKDSLHIFGIYAEQLLATLHKWQKRIVCLSDAIKCAVIALVYFNIAESLPISEEEEEWISKKIEEQNIFKSRTIYLLQIRKNCLGSPVDISSGNL
jgi:hypothetical protein